MLDFQPGSPETAKIKEASFSAVLYEISSNQNFRGGLDADRNEKGGPCSNTVRHQRGRNPNWRNKKPSCSESDSAKSKSVYQPDPPLAL